MSRTTIDHSGHPHPCTKAARAACRAALRKAAEAGPVEITADGRIVPVTPSVSLVKPTKAATPADVKPRTRRSSKAV